MQVRPYGTTYMPRLEMKRGTRNADQGISAPTHIYQQEQGDPEVPRVTPGDARVVPDLYRATARRRLTRAVAIYAELALAVMAAAAYGTLIAFTESVLDAGHYVNAADHAVRGGVVVGVLTLIAWGRSAHRRWFAESTEPVPAMSDREADALAYIVTGLAEIEQHGLLRPEPRAVTQEVTR